MDNFIALIRKKFFLNAFVALFYVLTFTFIFGNGFYHLIVTNSFSHTQDQVNEFLSLGEMISTDAKRTLDSLNSLKPQKCDSSLINKMLTAQYKSDYAKDIGYSSNNELVCTTGLGILNRPFKEIPPQFVSPEGFDMWLDVPIKLFDFQRSGTVAKQGNFNVVMNLGNFFDSAINTHQSAVYAKADETRLIFQAGDPNLRPYKHENYNKISLDGFYSFKCSDSTFICAITYIPMYEAISEYAGQITGIFILTFISTSLITLFLKSYLKELITLKRRFLRNMTEENVKCFYQPVIDTTTGKTIGCEVLVRWQDEEGQIVTPDKFLNFVKEKGKQKEFTDVVIAVAFKELHPVISKLKTFKVAFNIFPKCFTQETLLSQFNQYKEKYPNLEINLELTEDELVEAPKVAECITKVRNAGYVVSIDDFGTGYSSLSYLQEIQVDYIKIDRSFVRDLENGTIKSQLIPLIASIAKTINADIIIEGVETEAQYEYVKDLGIPFIQGYYFSKPLPLRDFTSYLANNK